MLVDAGPGGEVHSKLAYDLRFTAGGIRRQVIRCTAARHRCEDCKHVYLPKRYKRRDKHLHGLKSWAMYQLVAHRISFHHLEEMFEDCFGLRVGFTEIHMLKSLVARRYRTAYKRILDRIVGANWSTPMRPMLTCRRARATSGP
jgi:hypothetical protein